MLNRWGRRIGAAWRRRPAIDRPFPRAAGAPRRAPCPRVPEALEPRALLAAAFTPAGGEFPINFTTPASQTAPSVAMAANGSFVVAWESPDDDGSGVVARRFDSQGNPAGDEFRVNSQTTLDQTRPAAASAPDGRAIVAWQSRSSGTAATDIHARRYDATGAAAGDQFLVHTLTDGPQSAPAVAADSTGGFVIAWSDGAQDGDGVDVFARRWAADGTPLDAAEFRVNAAADGGQSSPSVAVDGDGDFIVAWESYSNVTDTWRVFVRLFGADGVARGGDIEVTTAAAPGGVPPAPVVAAEPGGAFVVAWQAPAAGATGYDVLARRFDLAGAPLGGAFTVNAQPSPDLAFPSAAANAAGNVLITWQAGGQDGAGLGVYGRAHDSSGAALGGPFLINTTTAADQGMPAAAASAGDGFVVAWESLGQDGDGSGVFAQRLVAAEENTPPTTSGIAPVAVDEDAADVAVSLFDAFADSSSSDAELTYAVQGNTNPGLFDSALIDPATGILTLSFAPNASGGAELTVRATDPGMLWVETAFPVTVSAVNDAPVHSVPAAQQTPAATPLVFSAANQNAVSVSDVDAGTGPLLVTLGAAGGTLTLATTTGLAFTAGDGSDDATMTFTGPAEDVNRALDGMRFDPAAGFSGPASVTITTDDQGSAGSGGPQSDTDTIDVTVAEPLPPPAISVTGATVTEPGDGATADAVFTVTLSESRPYPVSVDYSTQDGAAGIPGTATAPADYAAAAGTLTFAPGETSKAVSVAIAPDALDEADEGFSVVLSNAAGGTIQTNSAAGRIIDDDPMPVATISDVTVSEGNPGPAGVAEFTISLSTPSGQRVNVAHRLQNFGDTAGRNTDYVGDSDFVTFEPGQTSKTIRVDIVPDALDEDDETFSVVMGYVGNINFAIAGDGVGTGTILDDDATPTLFIGNTTVDEGNAEEGPLAELTVILSAVSGRTVTTKFHTGNDSAAAPGDYVPTTGTLTFLPGETTKTVQARVSGDVLDEALEFFNVFLSQAQNATYADSRGQVFINDDDEAPSVTVDDATVVEGAADDPGGAGQPVLVTVRLTSPSGLPVTIDYATADGSAVAGLDYVAASGSVTFAAGQVTRTIELRTVGDAAAEADETFRLLLSNPLNASLTDGEAIVTVRDDDMPSISIGDVTAAEGDAGTAQVAFTVALSGPTSSTVTVRYTTADGTAASPADYEAAAGTVTFIPGEVSKTVLVTVFGDADVEADETFTLTLSDAAGAMIGDGEAVGTIANDDEAAPPAPRVAQVFLAGTAWSPAFVARLATLGLGSAEHGYSVPAGAGQLATLPWTRIDRIAVRFDAGVSVGQDDLAVRGINVPAYAIKTFSYDPATMTATWTLTRAIGRDRVLLDLDGDAPGGVTSGAGGSAGAAALLDGEWPGAGGAYPSGNGTAGGDFEFRLNVLPGDVNRDGRVTALDLFQVRQRLRTSTSRPGAGTRRYDVFRDVTAEGKIDFRDLLAVRRARFQPLPAGEPSGDDPAAPSVAPSATQDLLFSSTPIVG